MSSFFFGSQRNKLEVQYPKLSGGVMDRVSFILI